jgi:2-methylcitrate dehydratase PrpD
MSEAAPIRAETAAEMFARHVVKTRFEDLPPEAVLHAKTFILDTIGVGISGSTADGALPLREAAKGWGAAADAQVWGRRDRVPAPTAALINGFQVHCQEFDCVHEPAVLHPLATALPAALAFAERAGGVSGREFLVAVATGVDVSTTLGMASREKLRFFRPATSGGFGAVAAVGRLAGLDAAMLARAFGLQYAQTSGTMQPHVEGNVALPMQVGFNARAALQSCDLASQGVVGPIDTFEGPFGFMPMFEGVWDLGPGLANLGRTWQISQVSHKPFPAGRAGHGGIEGLMRMRAEPWFALDQVASVTVVGPPLIVRLCARPDLPEPTGNYARLCMAFIGAKVLQHGSIDLSRYRGAELNDPVTHDLARLFSMEIDGNPDPNALTPHDLIMRMKDGTEHRWHCAAMLASPERRLTREQHLAKFRDCCRYAADPLAPAQIERLIAMVDALDEVADMRDMAALLLPA